MHEIVSNLHRLSLAQEVVLQTVSAAGFFRPANSHVKGEGLALAYSPWHREYTALPYTPKRHIAENLLIGYAHKPEPKFPGNSNLT